MTERTLRAIAPRIGVVVGLATATLVLTAGPAHAAPCQSESGFRPQIELPVGEKLSSPGVTRLAAYSGTVDFGDGTTVPIAREQPFEHAFRDLGTYTVTSTGSGVAFTSDGGTVPCEENRFVITTVTVYELEARMTATRAGGSDNSPRYTFDASASIPAGKIRVFTWDFGDGSYGSGASAEHTYATPGRFTATLTILDEGGYSASTSSAVRAGDVTAIDLGEIAGEPELDPNVFAALDGGEAAGGGDDGGSGGDVPLLALIIGGVAVAAAALVLYRLLRPSTPVPATSGPVPPAEAPTPPEPDDVPADLPETVGDSGIAYAQEMKRTTAVKGTGSVLDYLGNFTDQLKDTKQAKAEADERRREELRKKYRETFPDDAEQVEMLVDNDMSQYGTNAGMVPDVAKDTFYDAPGETVKGKWWQGYADLWNRTFGPKK